ncbi:MAG: hypothetical protein NT175_14630 [Bacteroidetes bacterium]|nr:hypothetical protein [Bacteroidota bacterium]
MTSPHFMRVTCNKYYGLLRGIGFLSLLLFFHMFSLPVRADDAPITYAGIVTDAIPGATSVPIPITVTGFNDIGQFTLTLQFDTTRVHFISATTNPLLTGMSVTYYSPSGNTLGKLIFAWTGVSNISLDDGSALSNLTFSYITGTGILSWSYYFGSICRYKRYVSGSLIILNDEPKYLFYKNGGISYRGAPVTFAPVITDPEPGALPVPVTVNDFISIGALTLYLEYDSTIITYQNSFTKNPAFGSNFLVGSIPGIGTKKMIVIQWYGTAVSLPDGDTLCTLNFIYSTDNGTTTTLNWFDNGPSCEYADGVGDELIDMPFDDYYINGNVGGGSEVVLIDIILQKSSNCGEFVVKLKPLDLLEATLTKIIFTVKWAATTGSDVQLKDITATWPGLQQLGGRELFDGNYYVTFRSLTAYAVNWGANTENTIMTFRHTGTGDGESDFTIIPEDYSTEPPGLNTGYYVEVSSVEATGSITNNANGASLNCGLYVKDFLQGPYSAATHLMHTDLVTTNFLPMVQPYNTAPWLYTGSEQIASYPPGTVDWVLVELRTGTAANTMVGRRVGLLKNDGTLMDTNGTSPLVFHSFIPGNAYYVVVYHRSHLPVMTANAVILPNTAATRHDFTTNPSANVYSTTNAAVLPLEDGVYGQITGDLNHDNCLKFSGPGNDRGLIIAKIIAVYTPPPATLNSVITGYYNEDLNMNSVVKYSGSQNDQGIIFSNIDALTNPTILTTVYQGQVPVSYAGQNP